MDAKNPKYADQSNTAIDLEVNHPVYGWIPFTATSYDVEEHGRILYANAVAGDYGAIQPYTPPTPREPTAQENKSTAISLLQDTDWVNQPDVVNPPVGPRLANQNDFLVYRANLRSIAVTPQSGFLNWPVKPQEQWV